LAFSYSGFTPDGPMYSCEVLEDGVWHPIPMGWCGTGLKEQTLEPEASVEFDTIVPRNGKSHRFALGEPRLVTPDVLSEPPSRLESLPADPQAR
jgi:hypothetical protein